MLVHTQQLIHQVKNGLLPYDPDTPNIKNIYKYASLSCGAAITACKLAFEGTTSFSLSRPPGHHAGKNSTSGFCYFNSIAVAVKKLALNQGFRVAILDIDGHHGNGTEDIFKGEDNIIIVSVHQKPSFPDTGNISFGNCYNFPVYKGSSAKTYLEKFTTALSVIEEYSPDILGVSIGFDTHCADPLLELPLEDTHYYDIGKKIALLETKKFFVLEGGYSISTIGNSCYCFVNGLTKEQ